MNASRVCPSCRSKQPANANFCQNCGAALVLTIPPSSFEVKPAKRRPGCLQMVLFALAALMVVGVCGALVRDEEAGSPRAVQANGAGRSSSGLVPTFTPTAAQGQVVALVATQTPAPTATFTPVPTPTKSVAELRAEAQAGVAYEELLRYPERYTGKLLAFEGKVLQAQEGWFGAYTYLIYVTQDDIGWWDDIMWVDFEGDARLLEDDLVSFFGTYAGRESYTAVLGNENTVPRVAAVEIVRTGRDE